jgi:hypothetical protein
MKNIEDYPEQPCSIHNDDLSNYFPTNMNPGGEICIILLLIFGIELTNILPVQSLGLSLFWIPVVLSTLLHGTFPGLTTAGIAAGLHCTLTWSDPGTHPDYYSYLLHSLREPILWLLVVGLLGPTRQRQIDELHELREQAGNRQRQTQALSERCQSLRQEMALLEHSVAVSGAANAGHALKLLDDLADAPPDRLGEMFRHTLNRLLGAEGVEILVLADGQWMPFDRPGTNRLPQLTAPFPDRCPSLLKALLSERRVLSCAYSADAQALAADAAMAAPFFDGQGNVRGAVLIREVDPACLSAAGEAALSTSCFILGTRFPMRAGYHVCGPIGFTARWAAPPAVAPQYGSSGEVGVEGI